MSSQQEFVCENCGSTALFPNDEGILVCADCGTVSTLFRTEITDVHMPGISMAGFRVSSQPTEDIFQPSQEQDPDQDPEGAETATVNVESAREALAVLLAKLLRAQVSWLIRTVACSKLVEKYAQSLLCRWVDATADSIEHMAKATSTLGIVQLACICAREPVLPADLARWAMKEDFPMLNRRQHRALAAGIGYQSVVALMGAKFSVPTITVVREQALRAALDMGGVPHVYEPTEHRRVPDLPVGNGSLVLRRYIRQLGLPDTLAPVAEKLRALRVSAIHGATYASNYDLVEFVYGCRAAPYILCNELELMSDVLNAVRLSFTGHSENSIVLEGGPPRGDFADVDDGAFVRALDGERLSEFIRWTNENEPDRDIRKPPHYAREIEDVALRLGRTRAALGRVQGLQTPPSNFHSASILARAQRLLKLGIGSVNQEIRYIRRATNMFLQIYLSQGNEEENGQMPKTPSDMSEP